MGFFRMSREVIEQIELDQATRMWLKYRDHRDRAIANHAKRRLDEIKNKVKISKSTDGNNYGA